MKVYVLKILRAKIDIMNSLTTNQSTFMCFPISFSAICCSNDTRNTGSFTFSKVVLTPEETHNYQLPWEKQQKKRRKAHKRSICLCWCCLCTCLCKPVSNRRHRRVSNSKIERKTETIKNVLETQRLTVEQIHKWSSNFDDIMNDEKYVILFLDNNVDKEFGVKIFEIFLQQEHSDENLKFWQEVNGLKRIDDHNEKKEKMKTIYEEYLKPMASREVNISGTSRRKIEEELLSEPSDLVFDSAQSQVFLMMLRQSYPRFLTSDLFHSVVQKTYAYGQNAPPANE